MESADLSYTQMFVLAVSTLNAHIAQGSTVHSSLHYCKAEAPKLCCTVEVPGRLFM